MWEGERNVFGSWWWEKREYFKSSAKKKPENTRFQPSSDTGYLHPIKLKLTIPLAGFSKISKQTSKSYSIQHLILETTHGNCQAYAQLAGCVNTLITMPMLGGITLLGRNMLKTAGYFLRHSGRAVHWAHLRKINKMGIQEGKLLPILSFLSTVLATNVTYIYSTHYNPA